MAWSSASINATRLTRYNADKPLFVGRNLLNSAAVTPQWRTSGSWASGSDGTDSSFPASRVVDKYLHLVSKPTSAQTTWYLIFDASAASASQAIDTAFIANHNFGSIGGLTVTLEIADNNSFSSNLTTIATWSPGTSGKRLASTALFHTGSSPLGYTGITYVRIKMTKGASFTPQIGEVWLGDRRTTPTQPLLPWDARAYGAQFKDSKTESGVPRRYVYNYGQSIYTPTWEIDTTFDTNEFDNLFDHTTGYTTPLWFVKNPLTVANDARFVFERRGQYAAPYIGASEHKSISFELEECAPYAHFET